MPFFNDLGQAKRYAQSRPYFHPLAIEHAVDALGIDETIPLALDIACGTGQSSIALSSISERVVGFDVSWSMLANAESDDRVRYVLAQAEAMPFGNNAVPFASCALAFHWFDRDVFLRESWRVLKPKGLLFVYNNGFTGSMKEDPSFHNWAQHVYPERFPTPPRNSQPFTTKEAVDAGFELIEEDKYENEVSLAPDELVAYLITQTNVVAALEEGRETVESARRWLLEQVNPYFAREKATFMFVTRAWYFRKLEFARRF